MTRLLPLLAVFAVAAPVPAADPPPPLAEKFLHDGRFADGETASLLALDADPTDDEVRFGLGVIQFARAVENLGRALSRVRGGVGEGDPAVPAAPGAEERAAVGHQLPRASGGCWTRSPPTSAGPRPPWPAVKDDKVKLRLRLAKVTFDFAGTGKDRTTLLDLLTKLNGGRFDFQKANPDFRVHFDRGDVAWLRAYCHLLSAMVEGYRAVDEEAGFEERVKGIFPKVEAPAEEGRDGDRLARAEGGGRPAAAAAAAAPGGGVRAEPGDVAAHPAGGGRRPRVAARTRSRPTSSACR